VRQAQLTLSIFGDSQELAALEKEVNNAEMRGVAVRVVSFGAAPDLGGKVVTYLGQSDSHPTRFLLVVADQAQVLVATYPSDAPAIAHWTENSTLAILASAFINIEYYFIRMSNEHPALLQHVLWQVVEPEDVERYAFHFDFLEQRRSDLQDSDKL
jgi:hypothetical protein